MQGTHSNTDTTRAALLAVVGAALVGATVVGARAAMRADDRPPPDSAPGRTARRQRFGAFAVTGRTVTINRPRHDVYAFWRRFDNLPRFMENVDSIEERDGMMRWTLRAAGGGTVSLATQIVDDRPGESLSWRSVDGSDIETEGKVILRDAPAGRGTILTAIIAWVPPAGEIGRLLSHLGGRDPATQTRHELKRLKMLLETGEIATAQPAPR
jgi:uncharacterized membrane protein